MRAFYISTALNFFDYDIKQTPPVLMCISTQDISILRLCVYFCACFFECLRASPIPAPSKPTASHIHTLKLKASPV